MAYRFNNQTELREGFWEEFPDLACNRNRAGNPKRQNDQPTDTRCAFVDWIDQLERNDEISEELAERVTL